MPSNPHKPGASAATSFRADEIDALDVILRAYRTGTHPRDLARLVSADVLGRASKKVAAMKERIERAGAVGLRVVQGGKAG